MTAKNIPFLLAQRGGRRLLYVPPMLEGIARHEIEDYSAEPVLRNYPSLPPPDRQSTRLVVLFFVFLLAWHGFCAGWWEIPGLARLPFQGWMRLGALDAYRTHFLHEWYRAVTALSLHTDSLHLFSNVATGCLLLTLLCRHIGFGSGLFLTVFGGVLGNICNALYRPPSFSAVGFSTAIFACLGLLVSIQAWREGRKAWRKALLPLGAGAGLLAMLGTGGEHVDYAAHLFGMAAGLSLGCMYCRLASFTRLPAGVQLTSAATVPVLFVLAWHLALG